MKTEPASDGAPEDGDSFGPRPAAYAPGILSWPLRLSAAPVGAYEWCVLHRRVEARGTGYP